jgi:hypothetical protein
MSSDLQNAPNPENLSLEKLSPELMAQVSEALAYPVVPLCPNGQQLGSGVLVEVDGVSGILTAEHVIFNEVFQRATGLWTSPHLYSEEARDKPTTHFTSTNIQMDLVSWFPETPQLNQANPEWGPDLAFIRIPKGTNFESSLRAVRNFYSLARDPESRMQALNGKDTILAVIGAPGETSHTTLTLTDMRGTLQLTAFLAAGFEPRIQDDYDYFDVPVDYQSGAKLSKSFAGVSGGAVWGLVNPQNPDMHEFRSTDYALVGIAFYQDLEEPDPFIRSHGPRSLYTKFLPGLRDWLRKRGEIKTSFNPGLIRKRESD